MGLFEKLHSKKNNFNELKEIIENNGVKLTYCDFAIPALGFATFDGIYIKKNIDEIIDDDMIFFVIAHEFCHYLSFKKAGVEKHLEKLSSTDWNVFFKHVIHEEMLADKFGTFLFYKINKRVYEGFTQKLHKKINQYKYGEVLKEELFKKYSNNIKEYNELVNSLIIN